MSKQIILTPDGKIKIEEELRELKEIKRPEIISKIEQAKELGDLSENAEYHDAKEQQGWMESRISEIEEILKYAIIQDPNENKDKISISTSFIVEDSSGNQKTFTIVGYNEANPAAGKISNESPLGHAFLNHKPGDSIEIEVPKGLITYKIVKIL